MALTIGVNKRTKIYIDDIPIVVMGTDGFQSITIEVQDTERTKYHITDMESVEVRPNVFVSCGMPRGSVEGVLPRLVFDAPREVIILREELYKKKYGH